jgi:hypothetical protein
MFNNAVLDVFIGLMFIFLMYSLLATAINEFIATLFAYRHRMLEKAIEQMIDGKSYSYYWWDKLVNIFNWIFRKAEIIGAKKDADGNDLSLRHFMSNEKIYDSNEKTNKHPKFHVRRAKLDKKRELFASNIVNHPLYRRKAEHSILFKKPAYLKAETFSDILMDILSKGKSSSSAVPILMNDIRSFVTDELNNNPGLKEILNLYIEQANGDVQKFKLLLENWFDDTMERVSGWYKRQSNKILLLIGFCLALAFNVSTITIINKLSKDKKVREALVQNASDYVRTHYVNDTGKIVSKTTPPQGNTEAKIPPTDTKDKKGRSDKKDSAALSDKKDFSLSKSGTVTSNDDSLQRRARQQLQEIKELYEKSIEDNNTLIGLGWGDYGYTKDTITYNKLRDSLETIKDTVAFKNQNHISNFAEYKTQTLKKVPPYPSWWQKLLYILGQVLSNPKFILGFLITAFAVSLGAPFWFDLLNKFVNLRVTGTRPEANKNVPSKTVTLNSQPDPDSVA